MKALVLAWLLARPEAAIDSGEDYGHRIDRIAVIAEAIGDVSHGNSELAAFLSVQAYEESRLARESQICDCRHHGCDKGKAHGPWNLHIAWGISRDDWNSFCGESYAAAKAGALQQAKYYRRWDLEGSFAACGGSRSTRNDSWVIRRAADARKLASKL